MATFRDSVTKKICRFFSDVNELKVIIFESLGNLERIDDLPGWIRGSDVVDPKSVMEEVARLQRENVDLRAKLNEKDAFIQRQHVIARELTNDAKEILMATEASGGRAHLTNTMRGAVIQAGSKNFVNANDHRSEARWKAALDELSDNGLAEKTVHEHGAGYQITKQGYEFVDNLRERVAGAGTS